MAIVKATTFFGQPPIRHNGDICIDTADGDVDIWQWDDSDIKHESLQFVSIKSRRDALDMITALQIATAKCFTDDDVLSPREAEFIRDALANGSARPRIEISSLPITNNEQPTEAARSET